MTNLPIEGIEVVVDTERWDAYGPLTPRSEELFKLLQDMGGVNESVPPGVYVFNSEMLDDETVVVTLEPKK